MFGFRVALSPIIAQQDGTGSPMFLVTMVGFAAIFYLMLWRPQRQQEQKRKAMIEALKKNDKVVTAGGIYGTVTSAEAGSDRIVIRIDDEKGVKVTLARSSVARVVEPTAEKPAESS